MRLSNNADVIFGSKRGCHANAKNFLMVSKNDIDHGKAVAIDVPKDNYGETPMKRVARKEAQIRPPLNSTAEGTFYVVSQHMYSSDSKP
jgi:hypothetical protein